MRPKRRPQELSERASRQRPALHPRPPAAAGAPAHGFDPDAELVVATGSALAPGSAVFWPIAVLMIIPRTVRWIAWSVRDRIRGGRGRSSPPGSGRQV